MQSNEFEQSPLFILGAICARGGSKGVPQKNIRMLHGKPLIAYTIAHAKACSLLSRTIISTDDQEIAHVAQQHGAEVPFMRPAELAQDNTSKWDVFRHLVDTIEHRENRRVDVLVDLDIGVPLRNLEDISGCVQQLLASQADVVVTAYEAERNPYFNMIELNSHGYAKIVKMTLEPIVARQNAPAVYSLSPSVFAIRREALWKVDHWSQSEMTLYPIPRERGIDIDTQIDFDFVEFLMTKYVSQATTKS